jgi:hypothetical protein
MHATNLVHITLTDLAFLTKFHTNYEAYLLGVSPTRCPFILPKSKYSPQCYPDVQPPLPCPSLGVTDIYSIKLSWNQFSGFEMKRGQMKATVTRLILLWTLCKERKSAAVYCNCLCVSLFHIIYEYLMRYNIKVRTFLLVQLQTWLFGKLGLSHVQFTVNLIVKLHEHSSVKVANQTLWLATIEGHWPRGNEQAARSVCSVKVYTINALRAEQL